VLHVFERVKSSAHAELNELGVELKMPRAPFKRLSYSEALEILKSRGFDVKWGQDLGSDEERVLGEAMREEGYDAYFIVEYPWEAKPFYIMRRGDLSEAFDLDYRGLELASGGQREHRYDKLVENIRLKGLNVDSFSFYLEAFKYGMPPHGGFGLGLDRLIMVITGAQNIREVVLFPRDRQRLVP
jgi:aspartyl-tRNA synthetase